jgi:hypothetical protein
MEGSEANAGRRPANGLGLYRVGFSVAALYDITLGFVFFFFYGPIFRALKVTPPGHPSYAHLTAAFVFVQGVGYLFVARDPQRNLDLVRLGALYKLVYCAVAAYYLFTGRLLSNVFGWFAVIDMGFLALFLAFLRRNRLERRA